MQTPIIGYVTLYHLTAYFFIYAFLGWVAEVIYATLKTGKFVNRGFLNGPVCPVYGAGMALCVLLLNPVAGYWWLLFLAGGVMASALEFLTGFVLEKIFHAKWWDYSKEPFNLKGYICLKFSILWGLGILLIFNTLVPVTDSIIDCVPYYWWGAVIFAVFSAVMISDFIASVRQIRNLKENIKEAGKVSALLKAQSDFIGGNISDITLSVREKVAALKKKIARSRLLKAFPKLKEKPEEILSEHEKAQKLIEEENRRNAGGGSDK